MKKTIGLLSLILSLILFLITPVMAYEDTDVICSLSSLIKGERTQGSVYQETALGDLAADALKFVSGADAAVVCGGDLRAVLAAGDITWQDVNNVFSDNKNIATATVSAAWLYQMLETGVGNGLLGEDEKTDTEASAYDGFPQIAGITLEYDMSDLPGRRVKYAYVGETALNRNDQTTLFTICATEEMLKGGFGYEAVSYESLDMGLADSLADFLKGGEFTATTISGKRMTVLGTRDNPLIPRGVLFMVGLFICLCSYIASKAKRRAAPDRSLNTYVDPNR